jgi:hypothetical protein
MKEKEGFVDCPEQQVILYVEKEDGNYGPMQTGSYITKNFLDDYEMKRKNLENSLKEKVAKKEFSPIYYFMVLEDLSITELAARARIRKGKVRKHLDYEVFKTLDAADLKKYADVFNVAVNEMLRLAD